MSWLPGKAKGGTEGFKNIGTLILYSTSWDQKKSEPFKEETCFLMSWYNIPRARNFKSRGREVDYIKTRGNEFPLCMAHFFFRADELENKTRVPIFLKPSIPPFASPGIQLIASLLSLLLPLE